MQNPFQENLRKPWILFCTTILVLYSIMPVEHETLFYFNSTSSLLEVLMFLLAFPLGDLMFLFYSGTHGILERFVFWALAMGVGYAQWFHLFPAILRKKRERANTLNPETADGVALAGGAPLGLAAAAREADSDLPPARQFNERGMTPLERILRDDEED